VLADVRDSTGLVAAGEGVYRYVGSDAPQLGEAANGVRIASKTLELSNVDLTSEFSNLILMQRGYQAASQVLTTANEMLQQLLEVKGRR
jgi:flagellar hook protein FlgE